MWAAWLDPAGPPAGSLLDPIDGVVGRAVVDRAYCHVLLTDPAVALGPAAIPPPLRLALVSIRVDSLAQFAALALAAQASLAGRTSGLSS